MTSIGSPTFRIGCSPDRVLSVEELIDNQTEHLPLKPELKKWLDTNIGQYLWYDVRTQYYRGDWDCFLCGPSDEREVIFLFYTDRLDLIALFKLTWA